MQLFLKMAGREGDEGRENEAGMESKRKRSRGISQPLIPPKG